MKITNLIAAVVLVALAGCNTPVIKTVPPTPPVEPVVAASISKVRCPDLELITEPAPLGVLVKYVTELQQTYITCATRNDSLQEAVNKPKK